MNQFLRSMKLTTLLTIFGIVHASATTLAQKVSLHGQNAPLLTVFDQISDQTGYNFLFTGSDLKKAKPITIHVQNMELEQALQRIFANQPISYTVKNKSVVVKAKNETSRQPQKENEHQPAAQQSTADLGGTVTDSAGTALVDASVTLKGTHFSTKTDLHGAFNFPNLQAGKYKVSISYVGFQRLETEVILGDRDFQYNFILKPEISQLDELQVIAYGSESKRFSVGSVATVTAAEIEKQPITNPLLALQGQAPGLAITSTSGVPGSQVMVQVRGQNTLKSDLSAQIKPYDQPLIIVDGVPFATQNNNISQFASMLANQSGSERLSSQMGVSPFSNINPADIESISILKDADATSIYGSQGANGVILITTKKGKAGATNVSFDINTSFNSVAHPVQLLNTEQYLQLRRDAFASDGKTPSANPTDYSSFAPDMTLFDQQRYTNWQKVIYGKNTSNTNVHGSISGGTSNNTFIASIGYNRSNFNYPGDFSDQRFTLHSGLHHASSNQKFSLDLTTDFGYGKNRAAGYGGASDVLFAPNLPELLGPAGELNWDYQGFNLTQYQFYAKLLQPTNLENYNLNTVLGLKYKIIEGLDISANLGYNRNTTSENSQEPGISQNPAYLVRKATFTTNNASAINIEPQINYKKHIGKGTLSALVGATYKSTPMNSTYTTGSGYSSDHFLRSINGAPEVSVKDKISDYKYAAVFGRLNYVHDAKYIINLTGRRDGSSNFGPGHRFGNFGSVGAGWIFSEEAPLRKLAPVLSYGKLSGSYGTSGSDGIAPYLYQSLYEAIPYVPPFQGIGPSAPVNLYNPDYSWAAKKSLNIALDLGFFHDRFLVNATYYRNRESNQLVNYPLAIQTGFRSVLANLDATVQNRGFEFSLSSTNIEHANFSWRSTFNLSFNRNKLIEFPGLENSSYSEQYEIGKPTSIVYGYRYKGVNPNTGLFEFYTKDGETTYTPNYRHANLGGDQTVIADRQINYMGGLGNTFTYKQLSLYIFCQFASQNAPNYLYQIYNGNQLGFMYNQPTEIWGKYWTAPGDEAELQRLTSSNSSPSIPEAGTNALSTALNFAQSNGVYGKDIYLRVKTVSLSYQLPEKLRSKINAKGASVMVNAQNLFTFTNYKVGDPEQPGNFTSLPVQRIVALGLNFNF